MSHKFFLRHEVLQRSSDRKFGLVFSGFFKTLAYYHEVKKVECDHK
jgi:hypothetical protein